jgi:hypothetical protein
MFARSTADPETATVNFRINSPQRFEGSDTDLPTYRPTLEVPPVDR